MPPETPTPAETRPAGYPAPAQPAQPAPLTPSAPLAPGASKDASPAKEEGKPQRPGKRAASTPARPKAGAAQASPENAGPEDAGPADTRPKNARPETPLEAPALAEDLAENGENDENGENGEDNDQKKSSRTRRNRARRNRRKAKAQAEKARQAEAARANGPEDGAPAPEKSVPEKSVTEKSAPEKSAMGQSQKANRDQAKKQSRGQSAKQAPKAALQISPGDHSGLNDLDDIDDPDDFFDSGFAFEEDTEDFRFFMEEDNEGPDSLAGDMTGVLDDMEEEGDAPALPAKGGKKGKGGKTAVEAEKHNAKRKMFLGVLPGEQLEVVLAEEGQVQEYYVEMLHQSKVKGNIYKGVIHNVDNNLQAAFVSYGASKNGFLQIDEVHQEYYQGAHQPEKGRKYPPIQHVLKPGQEILVQVVKEPAGTKGAFLTTYLSLAGRFLVLTPGREQIGVSRKVENEEERARLRELLNGLTPGPGLGVIVRTVSMGASKTALQRDLQYLKRLWRDIRKKGTTEPGPCLLHEEADLTTRAVRDYLTEDIIEVWVDEQETYNQLTEVVGLLFPRRQNMVQLHKDPAQSLFARFSLQKQLDQVHSREVGLPSGGRLVIDHTEALTAIDINSGRSSGKQNFEDMAYRINMEAAQAIPLQLRLRDIGGQVVVDFIEMRDRSHWREVERTFRNAMKVDRARHDVGRISSFGLLEVVRQRLGSSAISISTELCPACRGTGMRRNLEWQALQALKDIQRLAHQAQSQNQTKLNYTNSAELILYLLNHKRERITDMEKQFGLLLDLRPHGM